MVAGREDFLMEPAVRGTICFFKALLNPEDRAARRLSLKLLWKLPEDGISEGIFDGMAETYRKKIKREKPQKVLEAWISDMNLQEEEGVAKLAAMSVFYKNMQEFLDNLTFGQESDLKRCGGKTYTSCLLYTSGYDYCQEYAVLPGEMVGELGVGFATLDEHDSPFWPQVNTCVYKERCV